MRDDFLIFGQPLIEQPEMDEVVASMKASWLGTGPKVREFEQRFAAYKGVPNVAAVNSCTAALHLAALALELGPGDEVITTAMTFCATINSIIYVGATPVLADIDPDTFNIDPVDIERKITDKTKAILIVHFAGRACDMDAIMAIAEKHNLKVIEDCAHAIETEYKGKKAGTFGDVSCFSFYATKNIVTGEGGMLMSNHKPYIDTAKIKALHGLSVDAWKRFSDDGYKHYYVETLGFKYNMMDLQAAIGMHQIERVDRYWTRRQEIWGKYQEAFKDMPFRTPAPDEENTRNAYHLYTIQVSKEECGVDRDDLLVFMKKNNIGVGVHYLAIAEHPFYQKTFNWSLEDFPHAVKYGRETLSLPLSPKLTDQDVEDVIEVVKGAFKKIT
ncbi:DegT/DnrJ/EryC1/StrS family aminotransferase [Candidatus Peregrinibacteria bacterium]|jgi:dTDP-4-amino-4,6-dideoxygalactose transaminase|nr:DegT/DnrJ/EryC1/StrS family aminotransferase [Candidatus Peregrinibacteria bacterium]